MMVMEFLRHWQGGTECASARALFSLSDDDILQVDPVAKCEENYTVQLDADAAQDVEITTYSDGSKTEIVNQWTYISGQLVQQ